MIMWVAVSLILSIGAICSDTNLATSCIVLPVTRSWKSYVPVIRRSDLTWLNFAILSAIRSYPKSLSGLTFNSIIADTTPVPARSQSIIVEYFLIMQASSSAAIRAPISATGSSVITDSSSAVTRLLSSSNWRRSLSFSSIVLT